MRKLFIVSMVGAGLSILCAVIYVAYIFIAYGPVHNTATMAKLHIESHSTYLQTIPEAATDKGVVLFPANFVDSTQYLDVAASISQQLGIEVFIL